MRVPGANRKKADRATNTEGDGDDIKYYIDTARIVLGAAFTKLSSVRPSVRHSAASWRCGGFAAVRPGGQEISIDCCMVGAQQQMLAVSRRPVGRKSNAGGVFCKKWKIEVVFR